YSNNGCSVLCSQFRLWSQQRPDVSVAVAVYVPEIRRDWIDNHSGHIPEFGKLGRKRLQVPLQAECPVLLLALTRVAPRHGVHDVHALKVRAGSFEAWS